MNICIIPARGGSKRIPKKNIKDFLGKPCIQYSIDAALKSDCFNRVIVSTDDSEISRIAKECGAEVPFVRPTELANDYAQTLPVIKHAIEYLERVDKIEIKNVCCIYATAPFVESIELKKAYQQLIDSKMDYCFSVTSFPFPIQRAFKITETNSLEMFYPEQYNTRSQDLEKAYHDAGQFYWGKSEAFKQEKPMFSSLTSPYYLPRFRVQDIDTLEDWVRAENLYKLLKKNK